MRRALFFIVVVLFAATSFASIPRASMLDRAREDANAFVEPLPETRVWASEVLAPFERPATSELTRALHQAYGESSTTSASGLRCFLSVDPVMDVEASIVEPQRWNRYAYVMNNPLKYVDPDGEQAINVQLTASADWRAVQAGRMTMAQANARAETRLQAALAGLGLGGGISGLATYLMRNPQMALMLMGMGMGMTGGPTPMRLGSELGAVEQRLGNIFGQELDNLTVVGAAKETLGQVVATKASGAAFDHVTKYNQAVSGAKGALDGLKKLASDTRLTPAQRQQVTALISKYSKKLDDVQKFFANVVATEKAK